jgi:hypothetical protein
MHAVATPQTGRGPIRWSWIIAGVAVILFLGVPCLIGAVAASVLGTSSLRNNAVAEGRAPGKLSFDAGSRRYVIALSAKPDGIFDGLTRTERRRRFRVRESDVSEARCTIAHPGGSTSRVRGDRQTISEFVGNVYATVGEFDGKGGLTTVACRFDPPQDLIGTRTETPLMVHEANSSLRYVTWGLFLGVFVFAGLGTLLILRGTVWRKAAHRS